MWSTAQLVLAMDEPTFENCVDTVRPTNVTATIMMAAIPAINRAYSTADAP